MDSTPQRSAVGSGADPVPAEPTRRRVSRARWAVMGVALLCVISGIGMLGYLAWAYVGTDVVARRAQAALTQQIRERWQQPTVTDIVGPGVAPALGSADALVRIPRFGADYEMPLVEGVRDQDLARGIGHFPGAGPGQIGNFAVAAHRVTHGEPFHDLPRLQRGDEVIVEASDAAYTYVLDTRPTDLVLPFTETWVIDPAPVAPEGEAPPGMPTFEPQTPAGTSSPDSLTPTDAIITLTTSSELFHTGDRMVAFGHLVRTTPK